MPIPDSVGNSALLAMYGTLLAGGGFAGYELQHGAALHKKSEQDTDRAAAARSRADGNTAQSDKDLRDMPSNRQVDWDKAGLISVGGLAAGATTGLTGICLLSSTEGRVGKLATVRGWGGGALMLAGVATIGLGVGALVSGGANTITGV